MHDAGEKIVLGHRSRRAAARTTASRCSTSSRSIRRRRASSRRSSCAASSSTRRRRRSSIAPRRDSSETDGDIREVVRTIVTSPEFFAAEAYRAKVKTPFEFVVSAVRATGTDVSQRAAAGADGASARHAALQLPAADRLRRPRGRVGQHRRAAQPHELRARSSSSGRMRGVACAGHHGPRSRDSLVRQRSPTTSRRRPRRRSRRRPIPAQVARADARLAGIPDGDSS